MADPKKPEKKITDLKRVGNSVREARKILEKVEKKLRSAKLPSWASY